MQLGRLFTRSCLTRPEVSLMASTGFFCLLVCRFLYSFKSIKRRSIYILQPILRGVRRSSANPTGGIDVCRECCVLSCIGLCDELIPRSEESYRLWCVIVCDLETL
jgi:hypothetical protein